MFEAVYHDNVEYKSKGIKLLLNDLKDMMKGLLDKLFYKTFKMITKWDENYLRHLRLNIETCIMNIKENLEKIDTRNNFQEYINVRNSLLEVLNKVKDYTKSRAFEKNLEAHKIQWKLISVPRNSSRRFFERNMRRKTFSFSSVRYDGFFSFSCVRCTRIQLW